ncbi:MAG: alpha-glucan family phosphorylase [Planctomycetaceae bacterium]|nr:alpha-glucan family phosphorylase [Planctomycetaceae bacterium]
MVEKPTQLSIHQKLVKLASNLWWSWDPEVTELFRLIDRELFDRCNHNPVLLLQEYTPEKLEERAREGVLHSRIHWAYRRFREYVESNTTWGSTHANILGQGPVAYFSAEFGLHESLPIYSGGLGVLAGDHLKSASDLGLPLVGVGLFYSEGYFAQAINKEGWQQEAYPPLSATSLPLTVQRDARGPIVVSVETRTGPIYAHILHLAVGRIDLYLLDTNIAQNTQENRELTSRLYGGDHRTRIRQELLLGVGGVRALKAIGILPNVIHMNEGHSAFAPLEVIRQRMQDDGLPFERAMRETASRCVFTTHTPVPAGHDRFDEGLIDEHLGPISDALGLGTYGIMGLGRVDPQNSSETFCMTVLALKMCRIANGVSNLHGVVSREMWAALWPWRSVEEVPIGHITNGVHVPTWLAAQMRVLYDRVLPVDWYKRTGEPDVWRSFESITPGELWEVHSALKNRLINYARREAVEQAKRRGESPSVVLDMESLFDPRALTIGFARRFAPYKRADLILKDLDFLANLIEDVDRPVQFIFAGKAHPADEHGKQILQQIFKLTREAPFRGRVLILENYNIDMGRQLVQGVDVWLNNPRRPLEASGTSGQKVVLNGGLNCSVLDGWWAEAYDGQNGFAIGTGRTHSNQEIQDARDGQDLYRVLTEEVIPLYFERDRDDLPLAWITRMKRAIRTLGWRFNADRMVMDYAEHSYVPAAGGLSASIVSMP